MSNRSKYLCLALTVLALVAGCSKSDNNQTAGTTSPAAKKIRLAFITNNAADFWTICRAGCQQAEVENPNIDVDFQIIGDATSAGQKRVIDDLMARGVDGIAISPIDPANSTEMLDDVAKQALLFCTDSDAPDSNRVCYIGTNNLDAGKQAGNLIKQALPNGGKIMIFVGKIDAQNARDRYNGIKQVLAGSNVQIIDVRTDDTDTARAKANAQDTLVKYPDIAGLVGLWSYNGPAILSAVREAGKAGQVKIVCFDEDTETLAGVKTGDVFATVVQQPFEFGRLTMINMAKVLGGDKSVIPDSKQIFIPTLAINKDNVDDFQTKLIKLRGH